MRIFGFDITRKAGITWNLPWPGWWPGPVIREPYTGAWQHNQEQRVESILSHSAVYACITLIAGDIAKLPILLLEEGVNGIKRETTSGAFSPVLQKPNHYQTRIEFISTWMTCKLTAGNTYVLKDRDRRNVVVGLYVLDPYRTRVEVAPDGSIFYRLAADNLSGIEDEVRVPASEIIHDKMTPLYHPLCGFTPLTACYRSALQAIAILDNSKKFFDNGSRPSGVLTAPGAISDVLAERMKREWEEKFTGVNSGRIAVLGDGLKYEAMAATAEDSQLIEQLKLSGEQVCTAFHIPPYMVGVGPAPTFNNIEVLIQQYYSNCLQILIESLEAHLNEGLGLTKTMLSTQLDLDQLLRMDTATKVKTYTDAIRGGLMSPNEAREKFDLPPAKGGESPMAQQQMYSLEALAERDAAPASLGGNQPKLLPPPAQQDDEEAAANEAAFVVSRIRGQLGLDARAA